MNEPDNVGPKILFNGKVYQSIEEMPPEERALFERLRAKLAKKYPGQNPDPLIAAALNQPEAFASEVERQAIPPKAWEGGAGTLAVPLSFEKVTNLGEAVNSYLAQKNSLEFRIRLVVGGLLFMVGGGLDLLALATILSRGLNSSLASIVGESITGTVLLFVGVVLLFGPVRTLLNRQQAIDALVIYRGGFAYRTPQQIHTVPWTTVASILSDETIHATRDTSYEDKSYLLIHKNGEQVTLTDDQFAEMDSIIKQIKQSVYGELLPTLQSAYEAGSSLAFGPVKISQSAGIEDLGRQFAWNTIYTVSVKRGRLKVVTKDEKSFDTRAKLIPNIEILCQLIGIEPSTIELAYF